MRATQAQLLADPAAERPGLPREPRELAPTPLPLLEFAQAADWEDVRGAMGLVYQNYREKGLLGEDPVGLRFTHFNLLPETAVFVAKAGDEVVATFSLVVDTGDFGLPMDALYRDELGHLRRRGRVPAEISGLAIHPAYAPISIHLIMNLVKMLYTYATKLGVTDLVVACHPKHARLYRRLFLFEQIGEFRKYEAVNDAPAVAVRLDLVTVRERYRQSQPVRGFDLYRFFFSDEIFRCPPTALRVSALSPAVNRRLLQLRPQIREVLEARRPGFVAELLGDPAESAAEPIWPAVRAAAGAAPVFVPA
ncbi:MAG: hypothetical protein Kow0092_04890 [Deferrisomatales bacterium]